MKSFIDLSSEVLIDRSQVRDPHFRLLLTAIGHEVVKGSPWVVVDKTVATAYEPLDCLFNLRVSPSAA
jgi:hypothetical protein